MQAEAPPPARSNELSSGPSSSQPARRRGRAALCRADEKSGARKGLASCRETTDCGTTRRSVVAEAAAGSGGVTSSGVGSIPTARSMSRLSDLAASETTASSARSASSAGVADGGLREDRRDPVEALELLGPVGVAAGLVRPDPGVLLAHQQCDDLELRAHRGRHAAALGGRLDLTDGAGEHRDDVVAGRGRVAGSAGRYGECPSGAGLVEPQTPPLECPARCRGGMPHAVRRPARRTSRGEGLGGHSETRLGPTDLREIDASGRGPDCMPLNRCTYADSPRVDCKGCLILVAGRPTELPLPLFDLARF